MGIIGRLLTKGPGGPVSIAKAILTAYNVCRSVNPDLSQPNVFRQVLQSRYAVIRKLDGREIDVAALSAQSIGDIITIVIQLEVPVAFERHILDDTFFELEKFYMKNAPDELESLTRVPSMIMTAREMKCSVPKPF